MKDMNMNAVRMSHYPPDAHFLDVCDSLGLYVLDELAGWHGHYDTPTGTQLVMEMIRHDQNHPSIILWDNGNEGGHNRELDPLFAANDIQKNDTFLGGIGVAVSDRPEGPFLDALGKPLIGEFHNGAQPIDPFVFKDDDGSIYLYYGGQGHCNVARLSPDLKRVLPMKDGSLYKEITPEHYVEGPFVIKRKGVYYFMWSEGSWENATYGVAYAKSTSPTGPFVRAGKILQTDPAIANGPGHHSVVQIPGTDDWYIVYHRHPLGTNGANQRVMAIDRLIFDKDGNIEPVKMTKDGPAPRPLAKIQ